MADITYLHDQTTLDIPVERVIEGAKEIGYKDIIIIGFDEYNQLQIQSNTSNIPLMLFLTKLAEKQLLEDADNNE